MQQMMMMTMMRALRGNDDEIRLEMPTQRKKCLAALTNIGEAPRLQRTRTIANDAQPLLCIAASSESESPAVAAMEVAEHSAAAPMTPCVAGASPSEGAVAVPETKADTILDAIVQRDVERAAAKKAIKPIALSPKAMKAITPPKAMKAMKATMAMKAMHSPKDKTPPKAACKASLSHEASREQYLVRVKGPGNSKIFSYRESSELSQAKALAEAKKYLASLS